MGLSQARELRQAPPLGPPPRPGQNPRLQQGLPCHAGEWRSKHLFDTSGASTPRLPSGFPPEARGSCGSCVLCASPWGLEKRAAERDQPAHPPKSSCSPEPRAPWLSPPTPAGGRSFWPQDPTAAVHFSMDLFSSRFSGLGSSCAHSQATFLEPGCSPSYSEPPPHLLGAQQRPVLS